MAESLLADPQTQTQAQTTNEAPQGGGTADSGNPFWSSVSEELKTNPSVAPFIGKSAEDVLKAYVNTKSMVGADVVRKLSKHATAEDQVKFLRDTMGLPSEIEKYEVKVPESPALSKDAISHFKEVAFKNGVLPWQFESILNDYNEYYSSELSQIQSSLEERQKEELATLKKEYGEAFENNMIIARDALKTLADDRYDAVVKEMNERGWGNSPELARLLVSAGKLLFTEGEIKGKTKTQMAMSPAEANSEIAAIQGNKDHPYNLKDHPNHTKAIEEMQRLYQFATATEET